MASAGLMEQLKNLSDGIANIDKKKLLRVSLGEEALQEKFSPTLEKIQKKVDFALEYKEF